MRASIFLCTWQAAVFQYAAASSSFRLVTQLLPEQGNFLRAQVRHLQDLHQAWRHFRFQLLQESKLAGAEQLVDLLGNRLAHTRDLGQAALPPELGGVGVSGCQRLAVGEDPDLSP
jgi:hypothetical protein